MLIAAKEFDTLLQINNALNQEIVTFSDKLEENREKVETAAQFHQLLFQNANDEESKKELARLAEKLKIDYTEKYEACNQAKSKPKYTATITMISTLIPKSESCENRNQTMIKTNNPTTLELRSPTSNMLPPLIEEKNEKFGEINVQDQCTQEEDDDNVNEDNDDTSKLCDSGVCDQFCTDEDTTISQDMTCTYSCQSIYDATTNTFETSHMDNLDDDDLDSSIINDTSLKSENTKMKNEIIDSNNASLIPLQTNAHLYCHTSNLQLDNDDSTLDQKTQK